MDHLINPRVRQIQISGIRQFFNLVAKHPNAISLTIGQPDFHTPNHVKDAGIAAIEANHTVYTANAGLLPLRQAVSQWLKDKYALDYAADDELIITHGSTEAIAIALMTILEPGCEVILPAPVYPGYGPVVELCGGSIVYADTRASNFELTPEVLLHHLTPRTRAVVLPYPSNPTGATLSDENRQGLARVLADRDIYVISDEVYSELIYDGDHHSIANEPGMREKTVVFNGLSKSHAMTGWRIGFCCAPRWLSKEMLKVHQYLATCATSVSQYAALAAVTRGANDAAPMRDAYRRRRDWMVQALADLGLPVVQSPGGAFYLFPSIAKFGLSSFTFAKRLLTEGGVAVVPGDAFSPLGEGYIRISYAVSDDMLAEAVRRMRGFLAVNL